MLTNAENKERIPVEAIPHQDLLRRERRRRPLAFWLSFLFLFAAAGLIIMFLWSSGLIFPNRPRLPNIEVTVTDDGTIIVRNIRISGLDKEDLPFSIVAKMTEQKEQQKNIINLRNIQGTLTKRNGEIISFSSENGIYDTKSQITTLNKNVHIRSEGRYNLYTQQAIIDMTTKNIKIPGPVRVVLSDGEIRASAMHTENNSNRIFFRGRVYATFIEEKTTENETQDTEFHPVEQNNGNVQE